MEFVGALPGHDRGVRQLALYAALFLFGFVSVFVVTDGAMSIALSTHMSSSATKKPNQAKFYNGDKRLLPDL
jgi:hypothetical protein